jgi:hypothetical protein
MAKTAMLGDRLQFAPLGANDPGLELHGTYIAGRAYIDGADETAAEMEAKWGVRSAAAAGRPELREKFDRQRYLLNQAIWHGELEEVRREAQRMVNAWLALDRAAVAAGKQPLAPEVWEVPLEDGSVAAIVQDDAQARAVVAEGRAGLRVHARGDRPAAVELSRHRQGEAGSRARPSPRSRRSVEDPLDAVQDTDEPLDQPIGF